jgi:hypothetical protein
MPLSEVAHSTAAERPPARPEARLAQTTTAPREPRAPRSSGHPIRPMPAHPMRGLQSAAARPPRRAGPNRLRREPVVPEAWQASAGPKREPAGSRMTAERRDSPVRRPAAIPTTVQAPREMRLEVQSGPAAPTVEPGRRVLPRKERQLAAHQPAAEGRKVRVLPMKAGVLRKAVRLERREIPTSEPGSYPPAAQAAPRASPRSGLAQPTAMPAHPRRAMRPPWASPARQRAGPSLGLLAAAPQSSVRQGLSAALWRAEPTSRRPRRSGCSAMQAAREALLSFAFVAGGQSSDRGERPTEPPPPKLCLRIQLASGWRAPFADSGWVSVTLSSVCVVLKYGIRYFRVNITTRRFPRSPGGLTQRPAP